MCDVAEIVNLNQIRKRRDRAERKRRATENRVRHGQHKASVTSLKREADNDRADLDGKCLDGDQTEGV